MTADLRFKRVIYKVSGESLMGEQGFGIDPNMVSKVVQDIVSAQKLGAEIGIVVGGGNIFRGVALAAKGADRVSGDQMGMLATVMNAISLKMAFDALGAPAVVMSGLDLPQVCERFTQRGMIAHRDAGKIVIFAGGTGSPYFTTDTGAALRASEFGAEAILKGTNVDGIYSADPKIDKDAVRYDEITYTDVLNKGLKVMDAAAVSLARDNNIAVLVFSIKQEGGLATILKGEGRFTLVHG
jgi:uridylate kinase